MIEIEPNVNEIKEYVLSHPEEFSSNLSTDEKIKLRIEFLNKIKKKQSDDKMDKQAAFKKLDEMVEKKIKTPMVSADQNGLSELEVADNFCNCIKKEFLYNLNTKLWHHWTGKVWGIDQRNEIKTEYRIFARTLYTLLVTAPDPEQRKKMFGRIQFFNSKTGQDNIINLVSHTLRCLSEDFDKNENYLNTQNGTIEFVNDDIIFREHRKEDMISHICNIEYNPEIPIPDIWTNHISTIMRGDKELIDNLQFILGYLLEGGNPLERFSFFTGTGRNGKSVTLRTMSYILGDYSIEVNPLALMEIGNKTNSPERKRMRGRRFILAQETRKQEDKANDLCVFDSGFIKACSGRDVLSFRDNHSNVMEEFYIKGQVVLSTNNRPKINDNSTAFWDRIIMIPFTHYFPEDERLPDIDKTFQENASGIFNWLIAGWRQYREVKQFKASEDVQALIDEYRTESDEYALFVRDCIEREPNNNVNVTDVLTLYKSWCKQNSCFPKTDTAFYKDMKVRYPKKHTKLGNVYLDIKLKPLLFN